MHETQHESSGSVVPFSPNETTGVATGDRSPSPAEAAVRFIGKFDEIERLFDDPTAAWSALELEIANRRASRERWMSRVPPTWRLLAGGNPEESPAPGTAPIRRERRPFVGFDREIATYERHKPELLDTVEGKWIVIVGDEVIGPFEDISDAERAGYRRYGLGPLFIKQVLALEPPPAVLPYYVNPSCLT